ncbi:MAG: acetylxylan esterase, partial [Prevotella sp.]|nr:acetylxylan esterase [Prevotella sp.]
MRKLLLALMLMISALNVTADNYPYRVDYLWVTVPDHADWLYECGENATIEVQFYKYGIPRDGHVNWKLSNDMLKTDKQGTATLKNGRCKINIGSRKTPGFRDLN